MNFFLDSKMIGATVMNYIDLCKNIMQLQKFPPVC